MSAHFHVYFHTCPRSHPRWTEEVACECPVGWPRVVISRSQVQRMQTQSRGSREVSQPPEPLNGQ